MNIIEKSCIEGALNFIQTEKIITVVQLSRLLQSSVITARRYLKSWRAYTSYNQKGLYHTLPSIPDFDENGLWVYNSVRFSRHGTLRDTIVHLLRHSKAGMSSNEIGKTVELDPSSFMHHFRDIPGVKREKLGGRFIYFPDDLETGTKQKEERISHLLRLETPISDAEAVALLVQFIKHPGARVEDLAAMLNGEGKRVKPSAVREFLERHDLLKKNSGLGAIRCFERYIRKLIFNISAKQMFPEPPVVDFYPEVERCTICGEELNVQKTRKKKVVTIEIGSFQAKETLLICPHDGEVYASQDLRGLSPARCTFGFNILVYVGKAVFMRNRNVKEIVMELWEKNVSISEREIGYLGRKFIVYLALAHRESRKRLNEAMKRRGGYILHIDGTCEGDSPVLFTGMDELTGIVLESIKIPSEHVDSLTPFLTEIRERYGIPIGLVHDMGRGILAAVASVFPGVADFICHFHFLRDIGKDLMEKDYQDIRKGLKKHRVRALLRQKMKAAGKVSDGDTKKLGLVMDGRVPGAPLAGWVTAEACRALIHWLLDYPAQMEGYGFPFDRPHLALYHRVKTTFDLLKDVALSGKTRGVKTFHGLYRFLAAVVKDEELKGAARSMEEKAEVFDALRQALCIALPEGGDGLNDEGSEPGIKTIEKKVKEFRKWVVEEKGLTRNKSYEKMVRQIDKYWDKLFADPIPVETIEGPKLIQPQRTNNILERFFRGIKRGNRQREGTSSLTKTLRTILAETPLVKNLDNEEYVKIILDGCETLEERFARIESELAQKALQKSMQNAGKISPEMKKLIRRPDFTRKLSGLLANLAI